MDREQANIQSQIRNIRRIVIFVTAGVAICLLGVLAFVPVDERVIAMGVVRAERDTYLYAPADGVLGQIDVYEGGVVEEGQPVLRLDDTDLQEKLQQIDAAIDKAKVELESKKTSLERTSRLPLPSQFWHTQEEVGIATERIRQSQLEFSRANELHAKGLVSQQDLERARLAIEIAKAEESKSREKIRIVEDGLEGTILEEAQAEIQAALSALRELQVEREICEAAIERAVLRSPDSGTVTSLLVRRPGIKVERGQHLARLAHGEARRVDIFCGETQYYRLKPGLRVLMRSNAFDPLRHGYIEGTVTRLAVEPESEDSENAPESNTGPQYRVIATVESTPQELTLGSTVEARIIIRRIPLWKLLLPDTL